MRPQCDLRASSILGTSEHTRMCHLSTATHMARDEAIRASHSGQLPVSAHPAHLDKGAFALIA